jgi:predicted MPP superfamily phosphohydrolase
VVIASPKIPESIGRIRIAQISDVHLGVIVGEGRLKRILKEIARADPDILVSTGDFVDGQIDDLSVLGEMLRQVRTRYGKFAVTGNHEFYAGLGRSLKFMEEAGFTVLRGEVVEVSGAIRIAGVDDPAGDPYGLSRQISEKELLTGPAGENFTILLKHRPLVDEDALGLFDLQISGHVHKGQIFPFSVITRLFYDHDAGLFPLRNGAHVYVSRGSGTWGPPIRFLSPPEVTIFEIVHGR